MRKNKMGAMFLVSVLALAGIGVSYAGFTDELWIYGTVDTATVTWEVVDYSGTDVWKIWNIEGYPVGYEDEVYRWEGFIGDRVTDPATIASTTGADYAELISTAWASEYAGTEYDILFTWDNIFPCQDFTVDVVIHYTGSIPAKINSADIWTIDYDYDPQPNPGDSDWLQTLWDTPDAVSYGACRASLTYPDEPYGPNNPLIIHPDQPVDIGTQLHYCDYIYAFLTIHLPQDNMWQDLYGEFGASVEIIQWNEFGE